MHTELLHTLLVFVGGVAIGIAVEFFKEPVIRGLRRRIVQRASERYTQQITPPPVRSFPIYTMGNLQIPVAIIVGSPRTPFTVDQVTIAFKPEVREAMSDYPLELMAARPYLLAHQMDRHGLREDEINDILPRLDSVTQGREKPGDQRGDLRISLSLTTLGSFFATNRSLDAQVIPRPGVVSQFFSNSTIREAYCQAPTDISRSLLSNPPGVDICVISRNINQHPVDQFLIRCRSNDILLYRGFFQVAATGYMSLAHRDASAAPSPFAAAVSEARQEIGDALQLTPSDFKLLGLAIKWEDLHPGFYGFIETGLPVSELLGGFRRDSYEGTLSAIPFTPQDILSHIVREKWHAVSAVAAIATLLAFFPAEEVLAVAARLPVKPYRAFFQDS